MIYRINFKRIIPIIVSAFILASCSAEKNEVADAGYSKEVTVPDIEEAADVSLVHNNDKDSSEFRDLKSGEYASAMKEEHFVLTYFIPDHNIEQTICIDDGNVFSEFTDPGVSYKILYLISENKQYMIVDDSYCETSVNDTPGNIIKIYSDLEYISSGTQETNGDIMNYDEFRQKSLGTSIRLLTDSDGKFTSFDQSGTVAEIKYFSNKSDDSLFIIPDDCKKVSEDDIRKALESKIASHNR